MSTFHQVIRIPRKRKLKKSRLALQKNPQKKGVCLKLLIKTPKKPNSAKRKVARLRLSNSKTVFGYIPGEGHSLKEHSVVLIQGGRTKDLPGLQYKLIRGKYDFSPVLNRKKRRSKYGTPRS